MTWPDRARELVAPAPVAAAGVRLWRLDLAPRPGDREWALADADDRLRAAAMVPEVAARFFARRALAAAVAGTVLRGAPGALRWHADEGRPFVVGPGGARTNLSLSTSGDVGLLGLGATRFALDVERDVAPVPDATDVAAVFFAPAELAWVGRGPRAEARFLATWVRKEAVVKFTGEGMQRRLDSFVVDPAAADARVHHPDGRPFGVRLIALEEPGLVAAVALPDPGDHVG